MNADQIVAIDVSPLGEVSCSVNITVHMDLADAVTFARNLNDSFGMAEREFTVMSRPLANYIYERNQEVALHLWSLVE